MRPRPGVVVLTESQARQAAQDRIDADSYYFQLQQAIAVAQKTDLLVVRLRSENRQYRSQLVADSVLIQRQARRIRQQQTELWLWRGSGVAGWLVTIFGKK